jgi:hypothetical protein
LFQVDCLTSAQPRGELQAVSQHGMNELSDRFAHRNVD